MRILEQTEKYRCDSEIEAKEQIENFRSNAKNEGYMIKKIGYEYKNKKSKGEIIDEAWVISLTKVHSDLWI